MMRGKNAGALVTRRLNPAVPFASPAVAADQRFKGVTVTLGTLHDAPSNKMLPFRKQFEAETGVDVVVEQLAAGDLLTKAPIEFVGQTG